MRQLMLCAFVLCAVSVQASAGPLVGRPSIFGRYLWDFEPPDESLMRRQTPRAIMIHHSGELRDYELTIDEKLRDLKNFSMKPGIITETKKKKPAWGDVPYHYYIDWSGKIGEGRALTFAGDTNTGYDTYGYIQIAVEGHFDKEEPNTAQLATLDALVLWLAHVYRMDPADIMSHNDLIESTDCPGKHLKAHLDALRKKAEH